MGSKKNSKEMKNIQESLKAISQEMQKISQTMESKLVDVFTELAEIKHSQEFLSASFDEIKKKIKNLEDEVQREKQENTELKERVKFHEKDSILTVEALNDLAKYSRRDCLEIKEVRLDKNECTDKLAITVAQKCGTQINKNDISVMDECLLIPFFSLFHVCIHLLNCVCNFTFLSVATLLFHVAWFLQSHYFN